MADTQRDDQTEQASHRRLQQAWEEGNIPMSRDVAMWAALLAGLGALTALGPALRDALVNLVWASADGMAQAKPGRLIPFLSRPLFITMTVTVSVALGASVAMAVQTRLGVWGNLALPDFKRVFGGSKLGRLFRREMLVDLLFTAVKVVTLVYAVWSAFHDDFLTLPRMLQQSAAAQLQSTFAPLAHGFVRILAALGLLAGLDLALNRYRYHQRMKMTKEEAKRDFREEEGDPMIRSRRRRRHRELAKGHARVEVPRADALVVNPTHVAVAIRYRPGEDAAPRVTAKGKGRLAEIMRELARENGIPIIEDTTLARLLYRRVKVGRAVPAETYRAVAAILAFVYRVLGRSGAAQVRAARGAA
jgi:flagellar biosynthesis protein FlhB